MKRLSRPSTRYRRDLQRVLKTDELRRYAASVKAACEQARVYSRFAPSLHLMRPRVHHASVRSFFRGLYDSPRKAFEKIKVDLRHRVLTEEVMRAVCQYCGLPAPDTLDHYLEKARFPELSLYTHNLIPCCWACNHGRKAAFGSKGERQVLHFYEDDVDSMPEVLTASVTVPAGHGIPVVTYSVGSSAHPLRNVYEKHFDSLSLAKRYREQAAVELKTLKERARSVSRSKLLAELQRDAASRARIYGPNDYLAALWRALAASSRALSWLAR